MNISPLILQALSDMGCPVTAPPYKGKSESYIVYEETDNRPAYYADDCDQWVRITVRVHCYSRRSIRSMAAGIRSRLRAVGFTILSTDSSFESEVGMYHGAVDAWIDGPSEESEENTWQKSDSNTL